MSDSKRADAYGKMLHDRGVSLSSWPSTMDSDDPLRVYHAEASYGTSEYKAEGKTRVEAYERIVASILADRGFDFFDNNPIRRLADEVLDRMRGLVDTERDRVADLLRHICPECLTAGRDACTCPPVPMSPDTKVSGRMHEVVSGLPPFTLLLPRPEAHFWEWHRANPGNFRHREDELVLFLGMHHDDPTEHCAVMSVETGVIAWRVHPGEYRPLSIMELAGSQYQAARTHAASFRPDLPGPFPWCTVLELHKGEFQDWESDARSPELLYLGVDQDEPEFWFASTWEGRIIRRNDAGRFHPEWRDDED